MNYIYGSIRPKHLKSFLALVFAMFLISNIALACPCVCEPGETRDCDTGQLGICAAGTQTCTENKDWGECVQNNDPADEICDDGLDNDCDGYIDDDDDDCQDEILGSITVCKIIIDAEGNIVDGTDVSGIQFTIPEGTPNPIPDSIFTAPLSLNSDLIGDNQINDAQCITYDGLSLGNYAYGEEIISDPLNWEIPLYNDQHIVDVNDLDDFFEFDTDNTNADGHIVLYEGRPDRTLAVLNQYQELPSLTIYAYKVVCEAEEYLPNWASDSNVPPIITDTTAIDYVNDSEEKCWLEPNWDFQWGFDGEAQKQTGDYVGPAPAGTGWYNFDSSTSETTPAFVQISDLEGHSKIWMRENLKEGYIPFTYPPQGGTENDVSAEILCHADGYNYDNYDYITPLELGETYYCVAFNAPVEEEPACGNGILEDGEECEINHDCCQGTCNYETCLCEEEPPPFSCKFNINFIEEGYENWNTGDVDENIFVGINPTPFTLGEWISLEETDTDLTKDVPGIAVQRFTDKLKIYLYGSHSDGGKEAVHGLTTIEGGEFTSIENVSGAPYENWGDDTYTWGNASQDEAYFDESDPLTSEFATIVTTHDDAYYIYYTCGITECNEQSEDWTELDSVDIGDETSESYHPIDGWSNSNLPGNYGGCGDGSCTYRQVLGEPGNDQCTENEREATVILHAGDNTVSKLKVKHLDGISLLDSFDVFVNNILVGHFSDDTQIQTEVWRETEFDLTGHDFSGDLIIKLVATDDIWTQCPTYGQVAIDFIELYGCGEPWNPDLGILYVIKDVLGGTALAGDFMIYVSGNNPSLTSFPGEGSPGTTVMLGPGVYSVSESTSSDYITLLSDDCANTIGTGEIKTCTITNTYQSECIPTTPCSALGCGKTDSCGKYCGDCPSGCVVKIPCSVLGCGKTDNCGKYCGNCGKSPFCGDGILNGDEECDGEAGVTEGYICTDSCVLKILEKEICTMDLNVMMVMDVSGSMGNGDPTKLSQAQIAANSFIDNLRESDQSGLVSFSWVATLNKNLSNDHASTQSAINGLVADGATNIGEAVDKANQELMSIDSSSEIARIEILLTDGKANQPNGDGSKENPADLALALNKSLEAAENGITMFTIGLGDDVNTTMLQNMAENTGAIYYFAPTSDDLSGIFDQIASETCKDSSATTSIYTCLLYTSPSPRDRTRSRMPSSA